jgi:succinate dehydrogenase / fumarate reductase iron-sulfur subunit
LPQWARLLVYAAASESITITDNAIIPLKERVVDRFFDPLGRLFRVFRPK